MRRVLVIPVGEVDTNTLDSIARAIRETYRCETVSGGLFSVPQKTYNTRRKQYHSTKILKVLEVQKPSPDELLLGVIDEDCYVPELNFVFGEADMLARIALIALPRLRQEFYGLEPDKGLFLQRAAKEAIHELGHTLGMGHCRDPRCIMHFSNSLADTDRKGPEFCSSCRRRIGE